MKIMNRQLTRVLLLVLAVGLISGIGLAATFQTGDVFASVSNGQVNWYRSNGTFVQTLNTGLGGFTTGSAADSAGNLYVTDFSAGAVSKFDNTGTLIGTFGTG
jgi:DNA-binding beta-propeller fold protein YncE